MPHSSAFPFIRGFTLADVLIGVVLTSFLVVIVTSFIHDVLEYSTFVSRHQQIRLETFALVNNSLASLLREAVAIDYGGTSTDQLSLFMDKLETKKVTIKKELNTAEDVSQMVLQRGNDTIYLNSPRTVIDAFEVQFPPDPRKAVNAFNISDPSKISQERSYQPLVRVTIRSHYQRSEAARSRTVFAFFEDPRISYTGTYTLRNYSFSNLRPS